MSVAMFYVWYIDDFRRMPACGLMVPFLSHSVQLPDPRLCHALATMSASNGNTKTGGIDRMDQRYTLPLKHPGEHDKLRVLEKDI